MAAPTYNGTPTVTQGSASTYTGTAPTGTVTGELLFASIVIHTNAAITTVPTGWSLINNIAVGSGQQILAYYKIATGTDTAGTSYSWSGAGNVAFTTVISRVSGQDATSPVDTGSQTAVDASSGTSHTMPAVTTLGPDRLVFWIACSANATVTGTVPSPAVEQWDSATGTAPNARWNYGAVSTQASQGDTGTLTLSTGATSVQAAMLTAAIASPAVASVASDIYYTADTVSFY